MIGRNIIGTIVPTTGSSGQNMQALVADMEKSPCLNSETENICRDGRRVWINWTNRFIRDQSGRVVEILSVGNDITDLRLIILRRRQ